MHAIRFIAVVVVGRVRHYLYDLTQQAVVLLCEGFLIDGQVFVCVSFGCVSEIARHAV